MNEGGENRVKIYSYTKVWKVEKKIYSFSNIKLPFPINPYDLLVYGVIALIFLILGKIFPFINEIPAVLRYLAFPYLIATYVMKVKVDGKNPIKFFVGVVRYYCTVKGNYFQNFRKHPEKKSEKIVLNWNCSRGNRA